MAIIKERREYVQRFVRYYERAGASAIHIYFDDERAKCPDINSDVTKIIPLDGSFWDKDKPRPDTLESKQKVVYRKALGFVETKWALIVDCDEFVFGEASIEKFLAHVPDSVDSINIPTAEAVFGPDDDVNELYGASSFRLPFRNRKIAKIVSVLLYGKKGMYFQRGLLGHSQGKQFIRSGRDYPGISVHVTYRGAKPGVITVYADELDGLPKMYLGHFDGMSFHRWKEKWMLQITKQTKLDLYEPPRQAQRVQLERALKKGGEAPRDLFREFYSLTRGQKLALCLLRAHVHRRLSI